MQQASTIEGRVPYRGEGIADLKLTDNKSTMYSGEFNRGSGENIEVPRLMSQILIVSLFATCFGLVLGAMDYFHSGSLLSAITHMADVLLWGLLVPFLLAADRRLPFSDKQLPLRIIAHMVMSIPFVAIHVGIQVFTEFQFKDVTWNPFRIPANLYYYFLGGVISYFAVSGAIIAYRYYSRYQIAQLNLLQVQKRFLEAHLHNLRMQLEPHFVANALNAISSEVDVNPSRARQLIENIGVLLRLSHEYKDRQLIPLIEELAVLEHYVAIQKVRFGERLNIRMRVAPNVRYAMVPSFLLQPLAENAVRHGLEPTLLKGIITISAKRFDDYVCIRVLDNGIGLPRGWQLHETTTGQGLTITRERLTALYPGEKVHLTVTPRRRRGTEVKISIPYREVG